jgi:hypothetical protein
LKAAVEKATAAADKATAEMATVVVDAVQWERVCPTCPAYVFMRRILSAPAVNMNGQEAAK